MLLSLYTPVLCAETLCGVVSGVLLDPTRRHVAFILVQQLGLLAPERMLPLTDVSAADAHALQLHPNEEALTEYGAFSEPVSAYHLEPEPPSWTEEHMLRHGARVIAVDGPIGRVGALLLRPEDWAITQIVLRQGHLWGAREVTVPIAQVNQISEFAVTLALSHAEVARLPTNSFQLP